MDRILRQTTIESISKKIKIKIHKMPNQTKTI